MWFHDLVSRLAVFRMHFLALQSASRVIGVGIDMGLGGWSSPRSLAGEVALTLKHLILLSPSRTPTVDLRIMFLVVVVVDDVVAVIIILAVVVVVAADVFSWKCSCAWSRDCLYTWVCHLSQSPRNAMTGGKLVRCGPAQKEVVHNVWILNAPRKCFFVPKEVVFKDQTPGVRRHFGLQKEDLPIKQGVLMLHSLWMRRRKTVGSSDVSIAFGSC